MSEVPRSLLCQRATPTACPTLSGRCVLGGRCFLCARYPCAQQPDSVPDTLRPVCPAHSMVCPARMECAHHSGEAFHVVLLLLFFITLEPRVE